MINLYIQYFKHKKEDRRIELDYCTKRNIRNPYIDKIHILLEKEEDKQKWMESPKVEISNFGKRMTFKNFVEYSNSVEMGNDIHIVTNLDIFFGRDIKKLKEVNIDNHFVALTRWNIDANTRKASFFNVNYSQDTWIWKGKIDLSEFDLDYFLGIPGIDNAICGEFYEAGYKVINPALDFKTYHLHQDPTRNYSIDDIVRKKLYRLNPTNDWSQSLINGWLDLTNYTGV